MCTLIRNFEEVNWSMGKTLAVSKVSGNKTVKSDPTKKKGITLKKIMKSWQLYVLLLPAVLYTLIFAYFPMYGLQIAFKDFVANLGVWGSPWVGFKHFIKLIESYNFMQILGNTLGISIYGILVGFPLPILFALVINEANNGFFKKMVQQVTYAPNFISIVVLVGMINVFFADGPTGIMNVLLDKVGLEPVAWLSKASLFKSLYVWSGVWQATGWSAIIYIAKLSGVDPELHEAAMIDGASRLQRLIHINVPSLLPTITIMFIMAVGGILGVGYEKIYLMQNKLVIDTSEVISTYVYKVGLVNGQYSFSTAVGLMNSVVGIVLLSVTNQLCKRFGGTTLW